MFTWLYAARPPEVTPGLAQAVPLELSSCMPWHPAHPLVYAVCTRPGQRHCGPVTGIPFWSFTPGCAIAACPLAVQKSVPVFGQ